MHGVHLVFEMLVPSPPTAKPNAGRHVDQAVHVLAPEAAVKVPLAHIMQSRLLLVVAGSEVYLPAAHGASTCLHTLSSSVLEYVPATHGWHTVSELAVPAETCPQPAGHVL